MPLKPSIAPPLLLIALLLAQPAPTPSAYAQTTRRLNHQGIQAYQDKDYTEALAKFQAAQKKTPDNPQLQYNKAAALAQEEKTQNDALQAFEKASSSPDPKIATNATYAQGVLHHKQAQKLAQEQKLQEAINSATAALQADQKTLRQDPNNHDARYNYELTHRLKETLEKQLQQQKQENKDQKQDDKENKDQEKKDQEKQDQKENKDQQKNDDQNKQEENQQDQNKQEEQEKQDQKNQQEQEDQKKENQGQEEENQQKQEQEKQEQEKQEQTQAQEVQEKQQKEDEKKAALSVLDLLDDNDTEALKRMLKRRYGHIQTPKKDW